MVRYLIAAAALAVSAFPSAPAHAVSICGVAAPAYNPVYRVTSISYRVFNIATYQSDECGWGITNSFTVDPPSGDIVNPFPQFRTIPVTMLLGVAEDLPNDPPGQQHLVLFTNPSFARSAAGIAFGTLFPNSNETALIGALNNLGAGMGQTADYEVVFAFGGGDARSGPNGNATFGLGDAFSVIAFSDAQVIGGGESFAQLVPTTPTPTPSAGWLLVAGIGLMAAGRRTAR
ncbi:MAG: hypothetical protein RQ833_10350 [Sphingomonadaceae bacterium]|nr:hypothetical protein [Sphingomonadaceae bacterium]